MQLIVDFPLKCWLLSDSVWKKAWLSKCDHFKNLNIRKFFSYCSLCFAFGNCMNRIKEKICSIQISIYVEKIHFLTWALHLHFLSNKWVSLNWGDIYKKINTAWKRILKVSQPRIRETTQLGFFLSKAIGFSFHKNTEIVANFLPYASLEVRKYF